ncbi:hypothetical protein ACS0TY_034116 [Phlomoides rotata]
MGFATYLVFLFLSHLLLLNSSDSKCQESFQCDKYSMDFPFYNVEDPGCGLIKVDGCDYGNPRILGTQGGFGYLIVGMTSPNKIKVRDSYLQIQPNLRNCGSLKNTSLIQTPSISFTFSPNLTFFSCYNASNSTEEHFQNYGSQECGPSTIYYNSSSIDAPHVEESSLPKECSVIQLPAVKSPRDSSNLYDLLTDEYTVEWIVSKACSKCFNGGGKCLTDKQNKFYCKQLDGYPAFRKKILIGGVTTAALSSTFIILILFITRKYTHPRLFGFEKAKSGNEKEIELLLKNNGNLAPNRYKYSDIKKMTRSFRKNLGKGGYGSVYEGKLPDGLPVAVKILDESKGNGEEFMNEVASISRTSHINIVSLLGFCFEGCKRALIYEFMPNGSLEKFISNTASSATQVELGCQKLFEIALGIARGLEYLHQGCKTRILHFDIKPHNILLDKDFNPRISDFGLARLCPNRSSIVSMMVARGTIGYIAPEVFCRNFGEVSHKSDVYSYGMMLLEMAGEKKNIDRADVDRSSEIYFPDYIYKQLEMDGNEDNTLAEIMNEDASRFAKRKLVIVGLWCIQTDPKDRPSMTKVVEMLEGKLESLHVPPKPNLSSPPRSAPKFSTSESM